ncbi:MAG: hypothetical protein ABIZ70_04915 [Gemmatimonadales bacterium]
MRRAAYPLLLATACVTAGTPAVPGGLVVRTSVISRDSVLLALEVAPGTRINARLLPALEGARDTLRFAGTVDALGDYFAAAPTLRTAKAALLPRAQVVAGICDEGASVCHVVRAPIDLTP